ncbi:carbon dioxide transporter [Leptolyngbya sp. 'hensonii']|uniref:CO2 hydration protein n=1 Tax=Leptolyngbya sp. 'hensonii' TaxID=1922337 RepID=UPI00094F7560|nr:CO2 hydration protein [Leptolyngbya sp. 'hensonii']OLP16829.1 carbon dioxide transporter [Leptolyngbya sp. 'hensonii']
MVSTVRPPSTHPLAEYVHRLESGGALLRESETNLKEVVGILKSYGIVLDAYWQNLVYVADHQFLLLFPFFKYFNGEITLDKLLRHWWHDRINFEYAEYCMRVMLWHGTGGLDTFLDSDEFKTQSEAAIQAKIKGNPLMQMLHKLFPEFLPEQVRQLVCYSALGQFWRIMSVIFLTLSDDYDAGKIRSIADVVAHVQKGLVDAASTPITYAVTLGGKSYDIIPASYGMTFLMDVAVPYVEAVFFRGTPFFGTVSYNAQANQIPFDQERFTYGALYADPLPIGGAGVPPTLLMQDMRHFLPDYLHEIYRGGLRGEDDLRVKICISFQKSMFCVTTAAIKGLMPHPLDTTDPAEQKANRAYLEGWMDRLKTSCIAAANS